MEALKLMARPPFSLPAVIRSHGWYQLAPFHQEAEDRLGYVVELPGGRVVAPLVGPAPGGVTVTVDGALAAAERAVVARQVTWMLGLEQDLSPFYALARAEPRLARVAERAQGRVLRSPSLFEDTVKTILTTNTAWSGTRRMVAALVAQFGAPLPGTSARRAFPTPARLAAATEAALRSVGLGYRAPYVLELATAVATGELDLEGLATADLPTPDLRQRLLAIKGVGGYAAANLLMLLSRYDHIPMDSYARQMVSREWHQGQPVGAAEIEAAFARWGAFKGLAFWFWDWADGSG